MLCGLYLEKDSMDTYHMPSNFVHREHYNKQLPIFEELLNINSRILPNLIYGSSSVNPYNMVMVT